MKYKEVDVRNGDVFGVTVYTQGTKLLPQEKEDLKKRIQAAFNLLVFPEICEVHVGIVRSMPADDDEIELEPDDRKPSSDDKYIVFAELYGDGLEDADYIADELGDMLRGTRNLSRNQLMVVPLHNAKVIVKQRERPRATKRWSGRPANGWIRIRHHEQKLTLYHDKRRGNIAVAVCQELDDGTIAFQILHEDGQIETRVLYSNGRREIEYKPAEGEQTKFQLLDNGELVQLHDGEFSDVHPRLGQQKEPYVHHPTVPQGRWQHQGARKG